MKRLHPMIVPPLIALLLFSCKKYIQQQEEKAAIAIVTNGYWYVSHFQRNDSDITASFSGYLFKFDANNTVTGIKDSVSTTGRWVTDIGNLTITANFPAAPDPLRKLNETWKIVDSYTDSVAARSIDPVDSSANILQLRKQ